MRSLVSLTILFALNGWAQAPAPKQTPAAAPAAQAPVKPAPAAPAAANPDNKRTMQIEVPAAAVLPIMSLTPDTPVATVNGRKVLAGELQAILRQLPPQMQTQANADRMKFVSQYGLLRELADLALKDGLDKQSPWKEAIDYGRMQVLYQAAVGHKYNEIAITNEEIKKAYDAAPDRYQQAHVRAIYIPFSSAPVSQADATGKKLLTEAEAKAKAEDLVKQLKGGADFIKLVKEHSGDAASAAKDGDYGMIRKADPMAPDLKKAVFDAKPGEIAGPVRQANGFYIFRIEELGPQPLEQVSIAIMNELKNKQFKEWMDGLQKSVQVELEAPSKPHLVEPGTAVPPAGAAGTAPAQPAAAPVPKK